MEAGRGLDGLWPAGKGGGGSPGTLGPAICQTETLPTPRPNPDSARSLFLALALAVPSAWKPLPTSLCSP